MHSRLVKHLYNVQEDGGNEAGSKEIELAMHIKEKQQLVNVHSKIQNEIV